MNINSCPPHADMLAGNTGKRRALLLSVKGSLMKERRSKLRRKDRREISQEGMQHKEWTLFHSKEVQTTRFTH